METSSSQSSHRDREDGPLRSVVAAIVLTIFGLFVSEVTTIPAVLLDPALATSPGEVSIGVRTLFMILNFVGFVLAGAIYLQYTGRGWSYVDLEVPSKRGWLYIGGGVGAAILFYLLVSALVTALELPAAENQIVEYIGGDSRMVLIMILIVFFFNAPAEEFLFRNIVQKRLYAAFTRVQAVGIASGIFALVHLPVYLVLAESLAATTVSVSIVFGGAVIFGYLYARTDNLLVPIGAHATFNAIQFGLLYLAMEYGIEEADPTTSAVVDLLAVLP